MLSCQGNDEYYSIMDTKIQMSNIVGRGEECTIIKACMTLSRHLILEGPVGVGKTFLAQYSASLIERPLVRIDGDPQYTSEKLVGYFDPPMVIEHGYKKEFFMEGPLLKAMNEGTILFINELNRLPTILQNLLLTTLDEKKLFIPRLGWKEAQPGFCVIATQNPHDFIGTQPLSEALLDRFERLPIDYQSYEEELEMVEPIAVSFEIKDKAVQLIRETRHHPQIKRGASIRAAQAILLLYQELKDFSLCAKLALSTRIEWKEEGPSSLDTLIAELEKKNHN